MKKHLFGIFIGIGISLLAYRYFGMDTVDIRDKEKEIKELQKQRDSLSLMTTELGAQVKELQWELTEYDKQVDSVLTQISKINREHENEINSINKYTLSDLQNFFAIRYRSQREFKGPFPGVAD